MLLWSHQILMQLKWCDVEVMQGITLYQVAEMILCIIIAVVTHSVFVGHGLQKELTKGIRKLGREAK